MKTVELDIAQSAIKKVKGVDLNAEINAVENAL